MRVSILAVVLLAVGGAGCMGSDSPRMPGGVACTAQFVYGLAVTVLDRATGQRVCDAEVVAVAGSYREALSAFGPPDACTYAGAGERADVYELRASRPGFRPATVTGIRVGADECHVIPARVTVELER
jgi:hypothetical protein